MMLHLLLLFFFLFEIGHSIKEDAHYVGPFRGHPRSKRDLPESDTTSSYYYMAIIPGVMEDYYVVMEHWLEKPGIEGRYQSLANSYGKSFGVSIGFQFPFYGHYITNLTVSTGGFCYVGDQTHSWLAAIQYIAPLMSNFDTLTGYITFATNKEDKMVVSWNDVSLRDNRAAGLFNFQMHLCASGDIYFVYKDVPTELQQINDINHPATIGISYAYLKSSNESEVPMKRVLHQYHPISVPIENITSGTVVILLPTLTCLDLHDCQQCSTSTLNCSWCQPKGAKGFCSDRERCQERVEESHCSDINSG